MFTARLEVCRIRKLEKTSLQQASAGEGGGGHGNPFEKLFFVERLQKIVFLKK